MSTSLFKKCWRNRLWWAKPPLSPHKRSRPDSFSSVMSDNDLVSLKSGEINSISDTEHDSEKGGAVDLFADVFEEKESLVKLTSVVEKKDRVSVGNESSTVPLRCWIPYFCTRNGCVTWKLCENYSLLFLVIFPLLTRHMCFNLLCCIDSMIIQVCSSLIKQRESDRSHIETSIKNILSWSSCVVPSIWSTLSLEWIHVKTSILPCLAPHSILSLDCQNPIIISYLLIFDVENIPDLSNKCSVVKLC